MTGVANDASVDCFVHVYICLLLSCAWGVFVVILVSSMILSLLLINVLVVSYVCLVAAVSFFNLVWS